MRDKNLAHRKAHTEKGAIAMAQTKSLGELIKEARTSAGLTQEQLAQSVGDMTASDVSKAERGQKVPTQNQLKQIAKTTGVTQKSLLDAAKAQDAAGSGNTSSGTTASGKTASGKTTSGKTTSGKTTSGNTVQVTATEKKLLELYRAADSDKKKAVMSLLKGETQTASEMISSLLDGSKKPDEILTSLFSGSSSGSNSNSKKTDDIVSSLLGAFMNSKK